jgi:ubiquinone/menaquinone biosynthesis C-methylase UbiE
MSFDIKLDPSGWSKHAKAYNLPSGQALSFPMLQSAFHQHFFACLDEQVAVLPENEKLRVLALCGGTGPETLLICQHLGPRVDVLSTDTAQGMVDVCTDSIKAAGFEEYARSRVMDAMVS